MTVGQGSSAAISGRPIGRMESFRGSEHRSVRMLRRALRSEISNLDPETQPHIIPHGRSG